jgi:gliding motility-associated lipoprotein GldD
VGEVERQRDDSCWADFYFPQFDCRWHITYRNIPESGKTRGEHYEEYRKLVFKHIQKVSQIQDTPVEFANGFGTLFELYGTVAVPAQLLYGDSTHLVMVSFYFDNAIRDDSLAPVINFMKDDLRHFAQTLKWK